MSNEGCEVPLQYRRNAVSIGPGEGETLPGLVDMGTSRKQSPQNVKLSGTEYSRIMSISEGCSSSSVNRILSPFVLDEQKEEESFFSRLTDAQVNGTGQKLA